MITILLNILFTSNTPNNSSSITQDFMLGVLSGLVGSLLIFLFRKYLIPLIENFGNGDVKLSGIWTESYDAIFPDEKEASGKQEQDITIKLKQIGNKLSGVAELRDNSNTVEKVHDRDFIIVHGKIKNGLVNLTLEINDPRNIGVICYIMKVKSQGNILEGLSIYYNPSNERISPAVSTLKRKPDIT